LRRIIRDAAVNVIWPGVFEGSAMPQPSGAAIWDVDGTLVDTAQLHFRAWQEACRELGRPFSRGEFAATFGQRNAEIIRQLFGDRLDAAQVAALGERKEELYRAAARQGVAPLPGVAALLEDLRRAGFVQAVGSSAPRVNLDLILPLMGVAEFFDVVVSAEDTQRGKPDPQVFVVAAGRLHMAADRCVVFEDAVAGVQAARAGGMKCIAVRSGHHSEEALHNAGADLVVPTLEQVTASTVRGLLDKP
jgi:beta-phosphoglucomutase